DVARAGRKVDQQVIEFTPISFGKELLQRRAGHRAAPDHGAVGWREESDRNQLHAVLFYRDDDILAVYIPDARLFKFAIEHSGNRGAEDVGIDKPHPRPGLG